METNENIKEVVRNRYSEIALNDKGANGSCCGTDCCGTGSGNMMNDDYTQVGGYYRDADLGLGCGLPTQFAKIKKGDVVIDLGSGAGNDCFIARYETGETGKVIGVDFTEAMIDKARANAAKLGFHNIEFRLGEIENLPVAANIADVAVSNCVLNLVPGKEQAFKEIFRVLKPGGHFSISDVVLEGELPAEVVKDAEMYAGCISGAIQKSRYLSIISEAGFMNVTIQKEKQIIVPDDILSGYLSPESAEAYQQSRKGIFSITVYGEKPTDKKTCCGPECCN